MTVEGPQSDTAIGHLLDTRGLACPLPVLKAKKAIRGVPVGEILTILATDPGARPDFETFSDVTGHGLEGIEEEAGVLTIRLRRAR